MTRTSEADRMISFRLSIAPVPKGRPRLGRNCVYTPRGTKNFEHAVRVLAKSFLPTAPLLGALKARIICYLIPPKHTKRKFPIVRPDVDNFAKAILDALNPDAKSGWPGFWEDDSQVVELHALKIYSWVDRNPSIEISIEQIPEGEKP